MAAGATPADEFPAEWRALLDNDDTDISSICSGAHSQEPLWALLDGHSADLPGPVAQFSRTIDSIAKIVSNADPLEPRAHQVWGALSRTLELSKTRSNGVLSKVLGCFIELEPGLRSLLDQIEAQSPDANATQVPVAEALGEVILLCCYVIRTLWRNSNDVNALGNWDRAIHDQVERARRSIDAKMSRLEKLPNRHQGHVSGTSLGIQTGASEGMSSSDLRVDAAPRPYHKIFFPKNDQFIGRSDVLKSIHSSLDHSDHDKHHRAAVLWGAGGIGKTQIATAYAYECMEAGLPLILWINSETRLDLYQDFTDIALGLGLEGAVAGNHAANLFLVQKWLNKTTTNWLLIFDNVVDYDLASESWPLGTAGSVLLTSRPEICDHLLRSIEVPKFDGSTGRDLILATIARGRYTTTEVKAAENLSQELGGLALGLVIAAKRIRRQGVTVHAFLPMYRDSPSTAHAGLASYSMGPLYKHNLRSAYHWSFASLGSEERKVFGILSMSAADSIPLDMFLFKANDPNWPKQLGFCLRRTRLENTLEALLSSSLIARRDPETNTAFVHRVIQQEFCDFISEEERREAFMMLARLLKNNFPELINGVSLRKHWSTCLKYIHHVKALAIRFEDYEYGDDDTEDFQDFAEVLAPAGWFLHEYSTSIDCEDLMKMAFRACRDKTSVLYSVLLNNAAIVREKSGQSDQAIRDFEQCVKIREQQLSPDHEELANVYNNLSMPLMSKLRFEESEGLLRRALKIDLSKDEASQLKILHTRYMNLGWLYALMGRFDESRIETEKGRRCVLRQFGDNSYYIATCERYAGYVDYKQGLMDQARGKYTRAYSILKNIYLVHPTISSTLYMLGCVEKEAGNIAASIEWLEKTVDMARRNVPGRKDEGEVARASRKLSDALRLAARVEEADRMHGEAEDIRTRLQGAGMEDTEQDYDLLVPAQFRT